MTTPTIALAFASTLLLSLSNPILAMPAAGPTCAIEDLQVNGTYICKSRSLRYNRNTTEYEHDEATFESTFSMFDGNTFAKQGQCLNSTVGCTKPDNTTVSDSLVCVFPGFGVRGPNHLAHCRSVDDASTQLYDFSCNSANRIKFSVSMYNDDSSMPTVVASGTCTRSTDSSIERREAKVPSNANDFSIDRGVEQIHQAPNTPIDGSPPIGRRSIGPQPPATGHSTGVKGEQRKRKCCCDIITCHTKKSSCCFAMPT